MATVLHRLSKWAESAPDAPAQRFKKGGRWRDISAREYRDRVYHLALFLDSKGFHPGETACILSPNCPEWVHLDLAFLLLGGRSAGLYPNSLTKDIQYILNHTEARFLGIKDKTFFDKAGELPSRVECMIVFDGDVSISPKAYAYESAIAEGKRIAKEGGKKFKDFLKALDPQDGALLIYTSGTTANPKGALLSHDNLAFTSDLVAKYWGLPQSGGTLFSFLPLCHIAEKLQNEGVGISCRYTVSFCTKFENVASELPEVQPTLLLCVPRLWEKMMEGVVRKVAASEGVKKKLALWALDVGARVADAKYKNRIPNVLDVAQRKVAEKLVLGKIKAALGLGKANLLASGAAALPAHVSKWFRSLGLEILEDFGQTESTGVICMTEPGVESAGTVGRPVPGIEVKIADDGEVLTRGRHVFKGYYKDDAATSATLTPDGWLHTGDLAERTPGGLYRIKGRKKEIVKTSGGKMIAPLPIEEKIKVSPIISQACIVGDGRKFLSVLITLSEVTLGELKEKGLTKAQTITAPEILSEIRKVIDTVNGSLAGFEQIKKFAVLSNEFSIEAGEMTPTLKMKRNVIESRYQNLIDGMYQGSQQSQESGAPQASA